MKIQHKKFNLDLEMPEILQGQLEIFEVEIAPVIRDFTENGLHIAKFNGCLVREAAKVDWLPGINSGDVDTMPPAKVTFIADKVAQALREAREIPPQ